MRLSIRSPPDEAWTANFQDYFQSRDSFINETRKQLNEHPDAHRFTSLRGAGPALAPRLRCAFGSQKDRWTDADNLASFTGIAPVTRKSDKQCQVQRRYACPKCLRPTFHEFADSARICVGCFNSWDSPLIRNGEKDLCLYRKPSGILQTGTRQTK